MALALGFPHPDMLCDVLSADQLGDWEAFNAIDPIGGERIDFGFGLLATVMRAPYLQAGTRPMQPLDYFPWNNREVVVIELSPDDQVRAFDRLFF